MRFARLLLIPLLFVGCLRLDSFLFDPLPLKGADYFDPLDMDTSWRVRWVIPDSLREAVTLTSSGGNRIHGFFVRALPDTDIEERYTVIYCHGRGENINRYWGRVELLWEAGFNAFIFDYQGYGRSEGSPSGEALYADGRAALRYVLGRPDVDSSRLVYYSWSLGSFVAMHLAVDTLAPAAVVLENPLASVSALAKEGTVLAIPGEFLADADFDNERRIAQGPDSTRLLIIYGEIDDTAVPSRHAEVLAEKAQGWQDVKVQEARSANHDDLPETMGYGSYRSAIRDFVLGSGP